MAIKYRTAGDWGAGTGADLNPEDVDENFWELAERLLALETNPPSPAEISNIEVVGTQMMIYLSNGDSYGPYTLPYLMFRSRGDWAPATNYSFLDLTTVAGRGLYFVNITHTSDATFDPDKEIGGEKVYTLVFGESAYVYRFGLFYPMRPGQGISGGSYMAAHLFVEQVTLPAGLAGSSARLRVAPTAELVFNIYDQDDTLLGNLTFAATETTGTFTFDDDWTADADDYVYFAPPSALDDTARDLMVTIAGTRTLT